MIPALIAIVVLAVVVFVSFQWLGGLLSQTLAKHHRTAEARRWSVAGDHRDQDAVGGTKAVFLRAEKESAILTDDSFNTSCN